MSHIKDRITKAYTRLYGATAAIYDLLGFMGSIAINSIRSHLPTGYKLPYPQLDDADITSEQKPYTDFVLQALMDKRPPFVPLIEDVRSKEGYREISGKIAPDFITELDIAGVVRACYMLGLKEKSQVTLEVRDGKTLLYEARIPLTEVERLKFSFSAPAIPKGLELVIQLDKYKHSYGIVRGVADIPQSQSERREAA